MVVVMRHQEEEVLMAPRHTVVEEIRMVGMAAVDTQEVTVAAED